MPRAKATKKVVPVVEANSVETVNGMREEEEVELAKPKGRVGKKTKETISKAIKPDEEEEFVDPKKKPKKGRAVTKIKQNNDGLEEAEKSEEVLKKSTIGKEEISNDTSVVELAKSKGGRGSKKGTKLDSLNAKGNKRETTKPGNEITAEAVSKTKATRKEKKAQNTPKVATPDVAPSLEKVVVSETKGRKKKEATVAQQNLDEIMETKEVPKRGRAKRKEVEQQTDIHNEESPKKKKKVETETTEKKNRRTKKTDDQNDIVVKQSTQKTKKTSAKKNEADILEEASTTSKKPTGRKRNVTKLEEGDGSKPKKSKTLLNPTATIYNKADFELSVSAADGNISNVSSNGGDYQKTILKISSWNVAGLRSWLKKDGLKYLEYEEPDIFCLQEIKCKVDQLPEEAARIPGYHPYWLGLSGNYGGVALYSKIMPINVEYGIGNDEFDEAGHIITAEYEKFYLINVYVPNSGQKLVKLDARMRWEKLFQAYVKKLDALKPLIITGDMNVSHKEIDLSNPKSNTRHAGFTTEERDKMTELLSLGFVDTYRHLYPDKTGAYTFWTYFANARARNIGWRLDYFLVSERIIKRVVDHAIRSQCLGSDHCPITLFINI